MGHNEPPALCVDQVSLSYGIGETAVAALRGVSLTVGAGEIVALQGPSGSGKSSLLNICGLLCEPDSGSVHLAGQAVHRLSERERALTRRVHIGFIFQSFNLIPVMTAFENIEYPLRLLGVGRAERRARVEHLLEQLGLADRGKRRPDALSGGQRQRVAIGRALIKEPRLVIADEPTANLDSRTGDQIMELMQSSLSTHRTSYLIATHDPGTARRCSRCLTLHDGVMP